MIYLFCELNLFDAEQKIYLAQDNEIIRQVGLTRDIELLPEMLASLGIAKKVDKIILKSSTKYAKPIVEATIIYMRKDYNYTKDIEIEVLE